MKRLSNNRFSINLSQRLHMTIERVGQRRAYLNDIYHILVTSRWSVLLGLLGLLYVLSNAVFAGAYYLDEGCIAGARPESYEDAFFFSVHTMATVGYGQMSPANTFAHVISTVEVFFGLVGTAMSTGLVFTKFAVPTARVLFSKVAVVEPLGETMSMEFRMANQRGNMLVSPALSAVLAVYEPGENGGHTRRFYDLELERSSLPLLSFVWTGLHLINEDSPLFGMSNADLHYLKAQIYVSVTAIEEDLVHTVYARTIYEAEDLRWNKSFVDIIEQDGEDLVRVDYTRFHDVEDFGLTPYQNVSG